MNRERVIKIGILHFNSPFGKDLLVRLNQTEPFFDKDGNPVRLEAEHVELAEFDIDSPTPYHIIIDRGSHTLDLSIGIFNILAYKGAHIINNPCSFHHFNDRKDLGYAMIRVLGIPVPETIILPLQTISHPGIKDFRYFKFVEWEKIQQKIGFPCFLKPSAGKSGSGVSLVHNFNEL